MNVTTKENVVKTSAWLLYTLIVLEILFMVSPFAAYYYSIYATPLNVLQQYPQTAWLTTYVLPHFSYSDSWLANGLLLVSWPLILIGIFMFVLGFCQIYWSMITRKGAVEVGLYRHVRHPQYVALAVIGLGCALYWSRFIVIIAFVLMLCLYYFLARVEERLCLEKFGDTYRAYLDRTGRFLPRSWEARLSVLARWSPGVAWQQAVTAIGLVVALLVLAIAGANLLREHVIDSLDTIVRPERVIVFLAPMSAEIRQAVMTKLQAGGIPGDIAYVAPASWRVPELGLAGSRNAPEGGPLGELLHPTSHGNALSFDEDRFSVVVAEAVYPERPAGGISLLANAVGLRSLELLAMQMPGSAIIERRLLVEVQWDDIPVPTF